MSHRILESLYDATEEELLYGVGLLALPDQEPAPFIHIHYRDWSREKLEIVRESFREGLILTIGRSIAGVRDLHVSTRERIDIQTTQDGHTSVLRAPAWDARLEGIAEHVVQRFQTGWQRLCGFLLLMQTPVWEFLTAVNDTRDSTHIGHVTPRSFPVPTG